MIELLCFSTTTVDAINAAEPCQAACGVKITWHRKTCYNNIEYRSLLFTGTNNESCAPNMLLSAQLS